MSLTRIAATGRGRLSARLVIEGLPVVFVSAGRMQRTDVQDRVYVKGLVLDGMKIGASADLMMAELRGESLKVNIRDMDRIAGKRHGRVTRALWRSPTARAFLSGNITDTSTGPMTVSDTSAFPSTGVIHVGTECIYYHGKTATTFTNLTRGWHQTIAQAHFVADGEGLADALVTDQPVAIEGRRAYLYLYGEGDDPQGDGTLRWKGVCASDVSWSDGVCSIQIDPITRLLDQPIGGDLTGTIGIRGIHYTSASPLGMTISDVSTGAQADLRLVGFYETQRAFCDALTTAMAACLTEAGITLGTGSTLEARPDIGGWRIDYATPATGAIPLSILVRTDLDEVLTRDARGREAAIGWTGGSQLYVPMGTSWTPDASRMYRLAFAAPVPRATLGHRLAWNSGGVGFESPTPTASYYRVYLSGLVTPSADDVISLSAEDTRPTRVASVSSATRSIYVAPEGIPSASVALDATTTITLGRSLAVGDLTDLVIQLSLDSPDLANTGAMPLVTAADVVYTDDFSDAIATQPLASGRGFFVFDGESTLSDIIKPELMVLGAYQRITLDGSVEWARIQAPLVTDAATWTIDDSAGAAVSIEKAPHGVLGQVLYRMGYDPSTGEWDDRTVTFRDVQSTSATRTPITLEIAQRSTSSSTYRPGLDWDSLRRDDIARVAMGAFGLFGVPTATVVFNLDARYMDARIGDAVSVSSSALPDLSDGVSVIADRPGMVVAHSLDLSTGAVQLGVLMHTQRFAGYAPAFAVSGAPTNVSGNIWDITVTLTDYTDSTTVDDWLAAGDLVRVSEFVGPTHVTGTVTSIQSATVVRVTFGATWTVGADEWFLRAQVASAHAEADTLAGFMYIADSGARLTHSDGDVDAKVFS